MVEDPAAGGPQRFGRDLSESLAVLAIVVASAVAGALAGAHPTGTPVVDPLYTALLAGAVTAAGAVAGRATLLWLAAVSAAFSRGYVIFPALAALVLSFAAAVSRRSTRPLNALAAALGVQVALHLPRTGFQGGSALVAAVAVLPALIHGATRLSRRGRLAVAWGAPVVVLLAVLFSLPVALEALMAHSEASAGTTAAEESLHSVSDGDASGGRAQLHAAQGDFAAVAEHVGAWWTAAARLVPIVAQQRRAVLEGAVVARDVTASAGAEAGQIDFAKLHYQSAGLDLSQVTALRGPLDQVTATLTTGLRRLDAAHSDWLIGPLQSRVALVTAKVAKAQASASLADQAVAAAPSLFGGEDTRHYLLAVMDPSESRGLGGLVVSYGIVSASAGHLHLDQFQDISELNAQLAGHGGGKITGPPDYLARYGQNPAVFPQNVTYSPDLPTVTQVMAQLYRQAGGGQLDGMMVLDPKAIASLLNFSGPVQVPGLGQLDASNAEQVLEEGQYAAFPSPSEQTARRSALTAALKEVVSRLTAGSLPGPLTLSQTLDPDVRAGDLLFWSTHPQDQALLQRIDMDGAFPRPADGDLLGVVTSNAAANKIDAYLQRTVTDQVRYDGRTGRVSATVQVALHNEAPASGLSSEVIGSYAGSHLPPGTNRVWLSIYSPLSLSGGEVDGSSRAMARTAELGVETYGTFVNVAAGQTVTVTLHLAGTVEAGGYRLHVYDQPTVLADRTTVTVSGVGGRGATWHPSGASRLFRFFTSAG